MVIVDNVDNKTKNVRQMNLCMRLYLEFLFYFPASTRIKERERIFHECYFFSKENKILAILYLWIRVKSRAGL